MGFKTPGEVYAYLEADARAKKCLDLPWHRTFTQAFAAGMYVALGATNAFTIAGGIITRHSADEPGTDPGWQKLAYGAVFPIGIMLVVWAVR
eukprot:tig00001208_g7533.t1